MAATRTILMISILCALAGGVLVGIAFGTNHWREINVPSRIQRPRAVDRPQFLDKETYYSRHYGFFRMCFDGVDENENFDGQALYQDPLGYECRNFRPGYGVFQGQTDLENEHAHLRRTYVAFYAAGLLLAIFGGLGLCAGFGLKHPAAVCLGGILCFLAVLFLCAAGGIWHRCFDLLENYIGQFAQNPDFVDVQGPNYFNRANWAGGVDWAGVSWVFGYSYYLHWIGTGLLFIAAMLTMCGCCTAKKDLKKRKMRVEMEKEYAMYAAPMKAQQAAQAQQQQGYANYGYYPQQAGQAQYGQQQYSPYSYDQYYGANGGGYAYPSR